MIMKLRKLWYTKTQQILFKNLITCSVYYVRVSAHASIIFYQLGLNKCFGYSL